MATTKPKITTMYDSTKAQSVLLGTNFAFYFDQETDDHQIYPILGKSEVAIPGVARLEGFKIPSFGIAGLWPDRDVYYAKKSVAHIMCADPFKAGKQIDIEVLLNGQSLYGHPVQLDRHGSAHFTVGNLQPGEYTVQIKGTELNTEFRVAEYKLAPLTAELLPGYTQSSGRLSGTIALRTFFTPVRTGVKVAVDMRLDGRTVENTVLSVNEKSEVVFDFSMPLQDGAMTIALMFVDAPDRNAQVAIRAGKRAEDRKEHTINPLGMMVNCSILPLQNGQTVNGLSLASAGKVTNTPIVAVNPVGRNIELQTKTAFKKLCLMVFNPSKANFDTHEYSDVPSGERITFAFWTVWTKVYIAGWVEGRDNIQAWEGYTTFLKPNSIKLDMFAQPSVKPGADIDIDFTVTGVQEEVPVHVFVRPIRYTASTSGNSSFALNMLRGITDTPSPEPVMVQKTLAEFSAANRATRGLHTEEPNFRGGNLRSVTYESALESNESFRGGVLEMAMSKGSLSLGGNPQSLSLGGELETMPVDVATAVIVPKEATIPQTVHAGIHYVTSRGRVTITAPESIGELLIEAFAPTRQGWAEASAKVEVATPLFADLRLPAYVANGDRLVAHADVYANSGKAQAIVLVNSQPTDFTVNGVNWNPQMQFSTPAKIDFVVTAGDEVQLLLQDTAGNQESVYGTVKTMGKYTYQVRYPKILEAGAALRVNGNTQEIEVLPSLKAVQMDLGTAVRDNSVTPHDCCGQTADKMTTQLVLWLSGNDSEARGAFLNAYMRYKSMYVPRRGMKFYPHHDTVGTKDNHYVTHAAIAGYQMRAWLRHPMVSGTNADKEMGDALRDIYTMAENLMSIYQLPLRYDSTNVNNMQRAFQVGVIDQNLRAVQQFVLNNIKPAKIGKAVTMQQHPAYQRADTAYAAIICARMGRMDLAYDLAQNVFSQFSKNNKPYGYVDLYPTAMMLGELGNFTSASLNVNGMFSMTVDQAVNYTQKIMALQVNTGTCLVRVTELRHEDWDQWESTRTVTVGLQDSAGRSLTTIRAGDKVFMRVEVPNAEPGDIVIVNLPDALSLLVGGTEVKMTEFDLKGEKHMILELVATSKTVSDIGLFAFAGVQNMYVIVRNMDNEKVFGTSGAYPVTVV